MSFFAFALVVVCVVYLVSGSASLLRRVGVVVGTIMLMLSVYAVIPSRYLLRGDQHDNESSHSWYNRSPFKEGIGLGVVVLGMGAKYFFDAVESRRRKQQSGHPKARLEFDRWDFIQPFAISV